MRRFSQRNSLVTLSDINITPLLDLAFVLLIIFMITTPMLTQSLDLQLPSGGRPDQRQPGKNDVRTVEVTPSGNYRLNTRAVMIDQLEQELVKAFKSNPDLVVYVRADKAVPFEHVAAVMHRCQRNNITRFSVRTEGEGANEPPADKMLHRVGRRAWAFSSGAPGGAGVFAAETAGQRPAAADHDSRSPGG